MPFHLYAHLSWTTWGRLPLIDQQVAGFLAPFLLAEAKRHSTRVVEIGIVPDHVHMLLELPAAYDVPRLVQGLKGASYVFFGPPPPSGKAAAATALFAYAAFALIIRLLERRSRLPVGP